MTEKKVINIARVAASAGINVPVPAIKIILGAVELVDVYGDEVTLRHVEEMVSSLELTKEDLDD